MQLRHAIGSVVGASTSSSWSQVLDVQGRCAVIELDNVTSDPSRQGVTILSFLKDALEQSSGGLKETEKLAEETVRRGATSVVIVVPVRDVVYVTALGGARAYIRRGDTVAALIQEKGTVSGRVQVGDTLILVSARFIREVSPETLISVCNHSPAEDTAEKITLFIHQHKEQITGSTLVYQITDFLEDVEEPSVPEKKITLPRFSIPLMRRHHVQRAVHLYKTAGARAVRDAFFRKVKTHKADTTKAIAVMLILLFVVSVLLGIRKERKNYANHQVGIAMENARHALDEGTALIELNPIKGREKLKEASSLLAAYEGNKKLSMTDRKNLDELSASIKKYIEIAMQSYRVVPEVFYDVSLLKPNAKIDAAGMYGAMMGMLDRSSGSIFLLDLSGKNARIVGGGSAFKNATSLDMSADSFAIYAGTQGIFSFKTSSQPPAKPVIPKDDEWGDVRKLHLFGGNIYLLDATKGRIWKYMTDGKEFGSKRDYLNQEAFVDLATATSMTIDGSVWIGTGKGKVIKLTQGQEDPFAPQGLEKPFGNTVYVFTNEEMEHLYVLDSDNSRVVVLGKDGLYIAEYVWDTSLKGEDIFVSSALKKAIIRAQGKLFAFDLK